MIPPSPLPIDPVIPELLDAVRSKGVCVLEAPPGAGKTTRVPRALHLCDPGREVLVLEPRRLAARLAAKRVAFELGEAAGGRVGYHVRFDRSAGPATRILFLTEAMLTRRLLSDPNLDGASAVILDEFHERHLSTDTALAVVARLRKSTRPDLQLIVMSATLDAAAAATFLEAPIVRSEGRAFPVEIDHEPLDDRPLESRVASAVRALVTGGLSGHALVFLPGAAEIRRAMTSCAKLASENDLALHALHGDLPPDEQDAAIATSKRRKIILSTNIAESSITLEGVVAVIDSGLARVGVHDAWTGLPRRELAKTSRASAIQRAGRAGRTAPGRCIRLYTAADFERRPMFELPAIAREDLAPLVLELASGPHAPLVARSNPTGWLDAPPPRALDAAHDLLERLGALANGAPTKLGARLLRWPLHPRVGRVLAGAEDEGVAREGALMVALLSERDIRRRGGFAERDAQGGGDTPTDRSDLFALRDAFEEVRVARFSDGAVRAARLDRGAVAAVARAERVLSGLVRDVRPATRDVGEALLFAVLTGFPDRVAKRLRAGASVFALAGGLGTADLDPASVVRHDEWICAAAAESAATGRGLIRLASGIDPSWLLELFEDRIREETVVEVVGAAGTIVATSKMLYEGLVLAQSEAGTVDPVAAAEALFEAAKSRRVWEAGGGAAVTRWVERARFARAVDPSIPEVDEAGLEAALREACTGLRSLEALRQISPLDILRSRLGHANVRRVDTLAPDGITLLGGKQTRVEYEPGKPPYAEARIQDLFGMKTGPVVGGRPLTLHLLAPNGNAVQVTSDLKGFWERHYPAIKKELSRRYPRHSWPDDPTVPTPPRRPRPGSTG